MFTESTDFFEDKMALSPNARVRMGFCCDLKNIYFW